MIRTKCQWLAFAASAVLLSASGRAETPNPVAARVAQYKNLGAAFKDARDQLRGSSPDSAVLRRSSQVISSVAKGQYAWFPTGSGPRPGVKTKAKLEIWGQPSAFKAAQDRFSRAASDFAKAVTGGDVSAIQAGARSLGQACSGCHDNFRAQDS